MNQAELARIAGRTVHFEYGYIVFKLPEGLKPGELEVAVSDNVATEGLEKRLKDVMPEIPEDGVPYQERADFFDDVLIGSLTELSKEGWEICDKANVSANRIRGTFSMSRTERVSGYRIVIRKAHIKWPRVMATSGRRRAKAITPADLDPRKDELAESRAERLQEKADEIVKIINDSIVKRGERKTITFNPQPHAYNGSDVEYEWSFEYFKKVIKAVEDRFSGAWDIESDIMKGEDADLRDGWSPYDTIVKFKLRRKEGE